MNFNAREQKDKVVAWIREWFEKNGKSCNAIVGISGGKDSTVTAALCAEALGGDRVYGFILPNGPMSDYDIAVKICNWINNKYGFHWCTIGIEEGVNGVLSAITDTDIPYNNFKIGADTEINLPARIRMATLYALSQSMNGRVANTCNLSEDYVGYATKYGDAAGDFAPLKSFTTEEVIAIGHELGIPEPFLIKPPTDGLCGKTDEDKLGFTYKVLNKYIRTGEIDDLEIKQKIDYLHKINEFKEKVIERYIYEAN